MNIQLRLGSQGEKTHKGCWYINTNAHAQHSANKASQPELTKAHHGQSCQLSEENIVCVCVCYTLCVYECDMIYVCICYYVTVCGFLNTLRNGNCLQWIYLLLVISYAHLHSRQWSARECVCACVCVWDTEGESDQYTAISCADLPSHCWTEYECVIFKWCVRMCVQAHVFVCVHAGMCVCVKNKMKKKTELKR